VAAFHGEFVAFDGIRVNPKPVRDRRLPILVGGNSDAALRRVATWGDGWYGFNLEGVAEVRERIRALDALCEQARRDRRQLRIAVALQRPEPSDLAVLSDSGVTQLVLLEAPPENAEEATEWVASLAERWGVSPSRSPTA
jgi:hypothetical protein